MSAASLYRWWIPVGLGFVTAALLYVHRLGTGGDNLDFMLLARSIQHHAWIDILGWPRPGGYATFIAGLLSAFGMTIPMGVFQLPIAGIHLVKAANVLFHAGPCGVTYVLVQTVTGRKGMAMAVSCLVAVNQNIAAPATFIGAEPLFTLLAFAALQAGDRKPAGTGRLMAYALLVVLAANVKYQGVTLVGAFVLWVLINRAWRRAHIAVAVGLVLFVAGMAALQWYGNRFCLQHVVADDPYGMGSSVSWASRGLSFLDTYSLAWGGLLLPKVMGDYGLLDKLGLLVLTWPITLAVVAVMVWGFVVTVRRDGFTLTHGYVVAFHGLLLIWPDFLARYLLPVIPAGTWLLVEGVANVFQRLEISRDKFPTFGNLPSAARLLVGALLVWGTATNVFAGIKNWRNIIALHGTPPWNPARYEISREDDFADYIRAGEWIGSNAAPDAAVFCRKALFIELVSGRSCMYYVGYATPDDLWRAIEAAAATRPTYILRDAFDAATTYGRVREQTLTPALAARGDRLESVHTTGGGSIVYRVR